MVLRELNLTFETVFLNVAGGEHKTPSFTRYNPNGRVPALIDHQNNEFVIWYVLLLSLRRTSLSTRRESNAIISYLVEKYDTERKISAATLEDRALQTQWMYFQASGQGYVFSSFSRSLFGVEHSDSGHTLASMGGSL